MLRLIKKVFTALLSFIGSLAGIVNVSNHTKGISLNNQLCMTLPVLTDLNPDEHNQELCCYPFNVNVNVSCNTLDDLSGKICVPICVTDFNMITIKNESKT